MSTPQFEQALRSIDEANAQDPTKIEIDGESVPYEFFYSREVTKWVSRLKSDASLELLLAARCQHICRWEIPRASYPMTRPGYLKWRTDLKKFHAEKSAAILAEAGFSPESIARVRSLNLKENLGSDAELQVLEDALCLVTLEHQFTDLIRKTDEEKLVTILQKTWKKMSPAGHELALSIEYTPDQKRILGMVLGA